MSALEDRISRLRSTDGLLKRPARALAWVLESFVILGSLAGVVVVLAAAYNTWRPAVAPGVGTSPAALEAVLLITLEPSDTSCSIDGSATPGPYDVVHVAPGAHKIECRSPGFGSQTATVSVGPGQSEPVKMVLLRSGLLGAVAGPIARGNTRANLDRVSYDPADGTFYFFVAMPKERPAAMQVAVQDEGQILGTHTYPTASQAGSSEKAEGDWKLSMTLSGLDIKGPPAVYLVGIRDCADPCFGAEPTLWPVTFPQGSK